MKQMLTRSKQSTPPILYELDWKKGKHGKLSCITSERVEPEQVITSMEPNAPPSLVNESDLIGQIDVARFIKKPNLSQCVEFGYILFDPRVSSLLTSIDKIDKVIALGDINEFIPLQYHKLRIIADLFFFISVHFPEANKREPGRYDIFVDVIVDKIVGMRPRINSYRVSASDEVEIEACESVETALISCERMLYRISKKLRPLSHLSLQQIHGRQLLMKSLKMMVVWCCCSALILCVVLCLM